VTLDSFDLNALQLGDKILLFTCVNIREFVQMRRLVPSVLDGWPCTDK